ncbi:hypothetical protein ACJ72_08012 [Emergomyces africanus]|uniref:Uncharacterized protein n=1 Tax=Emergomyces africanus TaxID=1955775 RepID=A0A1B7NLX0_9EURO|nr:hypothetical protein ACJ72_08012 [Emergomyces africanus]
MATTYSVELVSSGRHGEHTPTIINVPDRITYVLRLRCSNAIQNTRPFEDMVVSCKMVTKDDSDHEIAVSEQFFSIAQNPTRAVSGPALTGFRGDVQIRVAGKVETTFCIKKRLEDGEYELMPGTGPLVPLIRAIKEDQLSQTGGASEN